MARMTTWLERLSQPTEPYRPPETPDTVQVRLEKLSLGDYMRLWRSVGDPYGWDQRLKMDQGELAALLDAPTSLVYVLRDGNEAIGLCEFDAANPKDIELVNFGLAPAAYGRRLGPYLLTTGLRAAWTDRTRRIWLHTDVADHPKALATYQRAGLTIYKQEMADF